MTDRKELTPPAGTGTGEPLERQIAAAIVQELRDSQDVYASGLAAAVMAVVQPALDAADAEIERLRAKCRSFRLEVVMANRALAAVRELAEDDYYGHFVASADILAALAASPNPEQGRTEQP